MAPRMLERVVLPVIAFATALILWTYVVGQKEMEWTFSLPVAVNLRANDVMSTPTPGHVSVVVKGPRRELDMIPGETIAIRLVLIDDQPGEYVRNILPSMVTGLPSGVEIIRIEPAEVRVRLDEIIQVRNRVHPRFGSPEDTRYFVTGDPDVMPKTVELFGTRDALGGIDGVVTDSIVVDGPPGARTKMIGIVVPDRIEARPQTVTVTYEIGERLDTRPVRSR